MLNVAKKMVIPVAQAVLVGGLILFFYVQFIATQRMNVEMHQASMQHRTRLDEENKASLRDRERISQQLERVERILAERP